MNARKFSWMVGAGLFLVLLTLGLALVMAGVDSRAARRPALPVYGRVADFSLTNQDGAPASLAALRGHVWIADIIFTRCAGACPRMSQQMKELQEALPAASNVKLVSLTTDPDFDTPPILKKYGQHYGADFGRWTFLTGTKAQIRGLAVDSLKLSAVPQPAQARESPQDLFVHSSIFVLIDKQAQLRGVFQTEGPDVNWATQKHKLLAAAKQLERQP